MRQIISNLFIAGFTVYFTGSILMGTKLTGLMQLFRPELSLSAGMCVLLGEIIALGAVAALFLVNKLGSFTNTKIASMKVNFEIEKRRKELERR